MTENYYWNINFDKNKYPCVVYNLENERIIFANDEFYQTFECDKFSVLGYKFYEVECFDKVAIEHKLDSNYLHISFLHKKTNKYYSTNAILLSDGKTNVYNFSKVVIERNNNTKLENALTTCMEIFQQPTEQIIPSFLQLLCSFYDCERSYAHSVDLKNKTINALAQFNLKEDTITDNMVLNNDETEAFLEWFYEQKTGFFNVVFDENFKDEHVKNIFETKNINNLTFCAIENANKELVGIVGISNIKHNDNRFDNRLLSTVSKFISQDIAQGFIEDRLFQIHQHDVLTGLYNRNSYAKFIDAMLESNPNTLGVISANINGLKIVNEQLGITGGDEFIKKTADRLKSHFGFDIFRMSGDEFLGVVANMDREDFEEKVFSLQESLKAEENYDFSIGHAWDCGNIDLQKIIFESETLMYINKQEYYANSEHRFENVKDNLLSNLLMYLENDEFMIYLQPQVRLKDGTLYGAEALIRRFDKTNQKMVFPDQFISLYEQKSIIRHVDMFVVETVCKLLCEWGKDGKAIPVSVNLSRVTLQEFGIVESIVEICDKYQVPHNLLVIEVTERVGLIENNVASSLITAFKDHGFNISLDDFGCAYSNIVTLAQIEVDEVKIDKSLVDDLTTSKKNHILVKNVLTMCNELEGASTLAEGIEDENQAKLLYELGCHLGQGYYYSRPIPVDEFVKNYINVI